MAKTKKTETINGFKFTPLQDTKKVPKMTQKQAQAYAKAVGSGPKKTKRK